MKISERDFLIRKAISEIFDGENPGPGKGCFQQAWSIGMLIKVLYTFQASKR